MLKALTAASKFVPLWQMIDAGRILVLGTGYVAGCYMRALHFLGLRPVAVARDWLDYHNIHELRLLLQGMRPQLVINAAGFFGDTVDDCETEREQCYAGNVVLPRTVGEVCKELDIPLIHISSGCIFNGPGPFTEESTPNNLSQFYAQCKLHAETELATIGVRAWVFRIRQPFGHRPHRRNLLTKLAAYDKILDGLNSITFIDEFALRSYHLTTKAPPGVYHAACSMPVMTSMVARMLHDAKLRSKKVELWDEYEFYQEHPAVRSAAVLDVSKFEKAFGTPFGDPLVALRWAIANFGVVKAPLHCAG